MNMFDEARSISAMIKMRSMTQSEIAEGLGVSQPYIANKLRLLRFSPECEKKIVEYGLTERHARAILRLRDEEQRLSAIETVHSRAMNVYECEGLVDMLHECELPKMFEHQSPAVRLGYFLENLDESVRSLRGLGYKIKKSTSYHSGVTYITLSLDEHIEYDSFHRKRSPSLEDGGLNAKS